MNEVEDDKDKDDLRGGGGVVNDIQVCMYELKVFPEDSKHLIVGWLVGCCKNVKWKLKKIEKRK